MNKPYPFLIFICIFCALLGCKTPKDFKLNGQPMHPMAIKPFFPSPVDGGMAKVVYLASPGFPQAVVTDNVSGVANKGIWYRSFSAPSEYVDYQVIGKTGCGNFVLLARSVTNTYQETRVEVIRYRKLKLRLKKSFDPGNIRDHPVVIRGNKVYVDSTGVAPKK